jgi:WD40 repeat protein
VNSVAFSPDGTLLATTSGDQTVRLWDTATGQPHGQPLTGHTGPVYSVAFSPDGTLLATTGDDRTVRRWDTATGRRRGRLLTGHTDTVWGVAFSPDGTLLATASGDRTIGLRDAATGQPRGNPLTGHTGPVLGVAFSPDGTLLATTSTDRTARLWDTATGQPHGQPLTGHTDWVGGGVQSRLRTCDQRRAGHDQAAGSSTPTWQDLEVFLTCWPSAATAASPPRPGRSAPTPSPGAPQRHSQIKPPRMRRRRILPRIGSGTVASGRGGRSSTDRCGRFRL